jgi:hypothetical protein
MANPPIATPATIPTFVSFMRPPPQASHACTQFERTHTFLLASGAMPKFLIERDIPGLGNLSDAQLREISQKSRSILEELGPEIQWLHSYVTGDKLYCVYIAPDENLVREHAKRGGFPANRISAVRRMIDPTTAE